VLSHVRLKRGTSVFAFVFLYLAAAAYLLFVGSSGEHPSLLYHILVFACFGALWSILENLLGSDRPTPVEAFWHLIVGAAIYAVFFLAIVLLIPGGFHEDGTPAAFSTSIQSILLFPASIGFCVMLMIRFRGLILYRRSRAALRSWRWMLVLMILFSLALTFIEELGANVSLLVPTIMIGVPLVVVAATNAFRVSWVVRLSAGKKALTILMAVALVGFCTVFASFEDAQILFANTGGYVSAPAFTRHYNPGMFFFQSITLGFGIIYCLVSILVLIFQLPTASDFRRREGEVAAIFSLTNLVKETFDSQKLLRTVVISAAEAHSATMSWLALPDPESGFLYPRVAATHNIKPEVLANKVDVEALYNDVASTQETLHLGQALTDRRVTARPGENLESLLVVPLLAHRQFLGALFIASNVTHGFDKDDLNAIGAFAAQAALALDNARLFERQVERERMARELAIAQEVQKKLLPQQLPSYEHLDMAAISIPAYEVGGDYYDYADIDAHRLVFIISDVSGKGTSAAFYMAGMQGIFQSLSHILYDPRDFLAHTNRAMSASLDRNVFVTAIYGLVDRKRRKITMARAGHCPAIIAREDEPPELLHSKGLGIGLDRSDRFRSLTETQTITMDPGDVMVLYTDGMIESRNANGEEYGYDRLLASVGVWRHEGAEALHAALLADLKEFMGDAREYDDDMTLLVFKWRDAQNQ